MVPQSQCYHPVLWNVGTGTQRTETFCLRKWLYMQVRYVSEWFLRVSVHTILCCGTGNGIAGTATFCRSGTGTVAHFGSRTGFGPGSYINNKM